MDAYTLIGLVGVGGYVVSYLLLQLELLDGNGVLYSVVNVVSAALVLVSLTNEFNLASALIQIIWIVIGVTGLALRAIRRRPASREASPNAPTQSDSGTYDLVPDSALPTGRPSLGLRADVFNAYQAANAQPPVAS